jgi:universal stress protein E
MESIDRILLAIDMKEPGGTILGVAAMLALTCGSEISLLHVIQPVKGSPVPLERLQEAAQNHLEEMAEKLLKRDIPSVHSLVVVGSPFQSVVEVAERQHADMIMIGSGTKEAGESFQLGVTAEQIIRTASKPVWVVKSGSAHSIDRILCPVDFSSHSALALEFALFLGSTFGADLTVLTVVERLSNIYPGRPLVLPEEQGIYEADQRAEFDEFLKPFTFDKVRWKKVLRQGKPHEEILGVIKETGCSLVVMGSEGRTGLSRILMGSVAEKVLRALPCSIVTLRAA